MNTLMEFTHFPASMSSWLVLMLTLFVKGALVLTAAGLLVYALRRSSAAVRYVVWCAGLLSLLALPVLSVLLPQWQTGLLPQAAVLVQEAPRAVPHVAPASVPLLDVPTAAPAIPPPVIDEAAAPVAVASPQTGRAEAPAVGVASGPLFAAFDFHWSTWVFMVWLAGLLFVLVRMAIAHAGVHLLVLRGTMVQDDDWRQLASDMANRLGIRRLVRLRWSAWTAVPLSVGVWRPTIILPETAKLWDEQHRRTVLLHELAHVRRRDCLMQFLTQVACAFHWFNPLAWVAARQSRFERERAADDMVLLAGTQASTYAEILLETARSLHSARWTAVASLAMARHSQLESRLMAILDPSLRHRSLSRAGATMAVVIAACIVLPLAVLNPAQAQRDTIERTDEVAVGTVSPLNDARFTFTKDIKSDSEAVVNIEPKVVLDPGVVTDDYIDTSYDYIPAAGSIWEGASMDTLTAEQRKMLRSKYGIDSTFIHEIEMLGFTDLTFSELVALANYDVDPSYIRGMQTAGFTDLTKNALITLAGSDVDAKYVRGMQAAGITDLSVNELVTLAESDVDAKYVRGMQAAGITDLSVNELVTLAESDVDAKYVRGMQAAGITDLSVNELVTLAESDVDAKYVRGMQAAGFTNLSVNELVTLADSDVDPNYVRGMQAAGIKNLSLNKLVTLGSNDIDPDYILGMQATGFTDLTTNQLVTLANYDIDPGYILGMQAAGFTDLGVNELVTLANTDIDPFYVREMQSVGFTDLTMAELATLADYDIDSEYIRGMQAAGRADLTITELATMADWGIDPDFIRGMQAAGRTDLTVNELITLDDHDIAPDYVRGMQAAGRADLSVNELITLDEYDIDPGFISGMQAIGRAGLTVNELVTLFKHEIDSDYVRGMQAAGLADLTVNQLVVLARYEIDPDFVRGLQASGFTELTVSEVVAQARKSMRQE